MRGTVVALAALLAAATGMAPATAKQSPYVSYEIVRVKPGGPATFDVELMSRTDGPAGLHAFVHLAPKGASYTVAEMGVDQYTGGTGRFAAYGWPVAPPCPAACEGTKSAFGWGSRFDVTPGRGDRLLAAGIRGQLKVTVSSSHWLVRETVPRLRVLRAESADATGIEWLAAGVEHFRSATLPGGAYGSAAFGYLPCGTVGVGAAFLENDAKESFGPVACTFNRLPHGQFGWSQRARSWTFAGQAVGDYLFPYRLVVVDYPKL